jgi:hypothetical protein
MSIIIFTIPQLRNSIFIIDDIKNVKWELTYTCPDRISLQFDWRGGKAAKMIRARMRPLTDDGTGSSQ